MDDLAQARDGVATVLRGGVADTAVLLRSCGKVKAMAGLYMSRCCSGLKESTGTAATEHSVRSGGEWVEKMC